MDSKIFTRGKYKGLTYNYVRINHTDYFVWLMGQPVCNIYNYLDFIKYCMSYTSANYGLSF